MNIVKPVSITSLALSGGNSAEYNHPLTNVINDHPESYFATTVPSSNSSLIAITMAGTVDCFFLVGVVSSVAASLTSYGSGAPTGYVATSWDDPWHAGRKNYLFTFDPLTVTGGSPSFMITLGRTGGDTSAHRVGVLRGGELVNIVGTRYPLSEDMEDPTTEVIMADGRVYRGAEMAARRIFSGEVIAARATVMASVAAIRSIGGRATLANMAPLLSDDFYAYCRATVRQVSHPMFTLSSAQIEVKEIV